MTEFEPPSIEEGMKSEAQVDALAAPAKLVTRTCFGKGEFDPSTHSWQTRVISKHLANVSLHPVGKYVILLLEALLIGGAAYGATQVYMDFQFNDYFTPDGSWLKSAFNVQDKYFAGDQVPFR